MKVAVITITYNDDYKFEEWCRWYDEYKEEIALHIIVDNGSSKSYLDRVKKYFNKSVVLERTTNGGCTGAYNDGLRVALEHKEIDGIMLLGNDIKLPKGTITQMYKFLHSNPQYGMVGAVVYRKDSNVIESYGDTVNCIGIPHINYRNKHIADIPHTLEVSYVGGGVNLAKRDFYESVGLQDENLFMYNDEMDMFYRAKKLGWKEAVTKDAVAWHQHISYPSTNDLSWKMAYLNGRNRVYIIKKHVGLKGILMFFYMFGIETIVAIRDIRIAKSRRNYWWKIKGFCAGIMNKMDNTFVTLS